ncbi:MAG: 3-deoxy-7-phosphoheptulonate synthase [Dehalococcoidia bacterium]|jgi:3-deoxy-7-phosphoheptulonate synthase|nr:3-deoxy-7-phosphoheptulonate synthase [Dehalococcoidia bacterium]|tara:strand:+ start:9771 stop:10820 length:1050 start_codon:yes stop_codon:yes gene_type:complete
MKKIHDLNIESYSPITPPQIYREDVAISDFSSKVVAESRETVSKIIDGQDKRILLITGPCSIHDVDAGLEYAGRLTELSKEVKNFYIVMRVYFEKPRTTVGWKGLINDPDLDNTFKLDKGYRKARTFLAGVTSMGMPTATEFLDPFTPQYLADFVSWGAIGARTTESQTHRQMASGLSMPIGFKNGTGGSIQIAVDAMTAARDEHAFLGINEQGQSCIIHTTGNKYSHLILRGSTQGTNFDEKSVSDALSLVESQGMNPTVVVDCSHANCGKDHKKMNIAFKELIRQRSKKINPGIVGIMLESHINEGNQKLSDPAELAYGVSITDPCINWEETVELIKEADQEIESSL